jgi:hypothetical protein
MWHATEEFVKYKKPTRVQKKLALGAAKGKRRAGSGLNFEAHWWQTRAPTRDR